MLELGKKILREQPFSQLLGTKVLHVEDGLVELQLEITNKLTQNYGYVHGGVISYLADNCLIFAGGSRLGECVTVEYKINYIKPVTHSKLLARASILHATNRQAVCECKVFVINDSEETLIAVSMGTIRKVANTSHRQENWDL